MKRNFRVVWTGCRDQFERSKRVPCEVGTGFTHVVEGMDEITYRVEINDYALRIMASKANKSKGKQSTDGPIRVVITGTKKIS
jgi:hypothetical protein